MVGPRHVPVLGVALTLSAVLVVSGCATPARVGGPAAPAPATSDATPTTDPALDAIAQALGEQGRGAYADTYSDLIVDKPAGWVSLYVTDAGRGRQLVQAAKSAHRAIDVDRVKVVVAKFSRKALDAQIRRIMPDNHVDPAVYSAYPNPDGSGITVTAAQDKVAALQRKLNAQIVAPTGIPVKVIPGKAATF